MEVRDKEITAVKSDVIVKGKQIKAIIDTGASVSAITNRLRNELEIPIERKSKEVLVAVNGDKVIAIGETIVEVEIGEWIIPMEVRVVESRDKTLIIGTNTLVDLKAKVFIEEDIVRGEIDGEEIEIITEHMREKLNRNEKEIYEEDSDSEEEKYQEEFEEGYEEEFKEPDYREFNGILEEGEIERKEKSKVFTEAAGRR